MCEEKFCEISVSNNVHILMWKMKISRNEEKAEFSIKVHDDTLAFKNRADERTSHER